jgi:small subunit ribosomal protein S16
LVTKIRLKRFGKKRAPFYRVVVIDSRKARDGQAIEEIGIYHPTREPSIIEVKSERVQYWLGVGAQPSQIVRRLLELTGDWAIFKGEKNTKSKVIAQPEKLTPEDKIQKIADDAEKLKQEVSKKLAEKVAAEKAAQEKAAEKSAAQEKTEVAENEAAETAEGVTETAKTEEVAEDAAAEKPADASASEGSGA